MKMISKLLIPLFIVGLAHSELTEDSSKDCVICHITWSPDYQTISSELPEQQFDLLVDGKQGRVSDENMCWSCHDGFVADSRQYFLSEDPHTKLNEEKLESGKLPLDNGGKIYCGSCHTPHKEKSERKFSFSPFLRNEVENSTLCLECHQNEKTNYSHPVHVKLEKELPAALAGHNVSPVNVECLSCHELHTHSSIRLGTANNSKQLCITCHQDEQSVAGTDHDLTLRNKDKIAPNGKAYAENGLCGSCHSMHDGKAKGLWAGDIGGYNPENPDVSGFDGRCISCHTKDAVAGEKAWSGHGHKIGVLVKECDDPKLLPTENSVLACLTCHNPHAWSADGSKPPVNENPEGTVQNSFLRMADTQNKSLCASCHKDEAIVSQSDHSTEGGLFKSPDQARVGHCTICHNQHSEEPYADNYATKTLSPFSSLCVSCHKEQSQIDGPGGTGAHGHPMSVVIKNTVNDLKGFSADITGGMTADTLIGCETCHDPHKWSVAGISWTGAGCNGEEGSSFLRFDNRESLLCLKCHEEQSQLIGSSHDYNTLDSSREGLPEMSAKDAVDRKSSCAWCHSSHNAEISENSLALYLDDAAINDKDLTAGWDKESLESKIKYWSEGARQCLVCHTQSGGSETVPEAWAHPLDSYSIAQGQGSMEMYLEAIDCGTCHDPHVNSTNGEFGKRSDYLKGNSLKTVCADCHGEKTLWKFGFYHDKKKRTRP
jgi:predicted CXXCH cytochrome family protein